MWFWHRSLSLSRVGWLYPLPVPANVNRRALPEQTCAGQLQPQQIHKRKVPFLRRPSSRLAHLRLVHVWPGLPAQLPASQQLNTQAGRAGAADRCRRDAPFDEVTLVRLKDAAANQLTPTPATGHNQPRELTQSAFS